VRNCVDVLCREPMSVGIECIDLAPQASEVPFGFEIAAYHRGKQPVLCIGRRRHTGLLPLCVTGAWRHQMPARASLLEIEDRILAFIEAAALPVLDDIAGSAPPMSGPTVPERDQQLRMARHELSAALVLCIARRACRFNRAAVGAGRERNLDDAIGSGECRSKLHERCTLKILLVELERHGQHCDQLATRLRAQRIVVDQASSRPRRQAQVGVVLAQLQPVFGAAGEHAVRLARALRDQVVDQHAEVGLVARGDHGSFLLHASAALMPASRPCAAASS
jgi:hypothetical protein